MSDVCYSELLRQARCQIGEAGRYAPRQDDPGYYTRRFLIALQVGDAADGVAELEALGTPFGIGDLLSRAVGPRLAQVVRLWKKVPLHLHDTDGWATALLSFRAYMEAIDADDEEEEMRRRADQERADSPKPCPPCVIPPKALSVEQAALCAGLSTETIEHLMKTKKLAYVQVGDVRGRVIRPEDLDKFLCERRQPTGEELQRKPRSRRSS
jgi:hypothetical protein